MLRPKKRQPAPATVFAQFSKAQQRKILQEAEGWVDATRGKLSLPPLQDTDRRHKLVESQANAMAYWMTYGAGNTAGPQFELRADSPPRSLFEIPPSAAKILEDVALAEGIVARENQAIKWFFDCYDTEIRRLVQELRDIRAPSECRMEGLTAYLSVEKPHKFAKFKGTSSLSAWLRPVVKRQWLDRLRAMGRVRKHYESLVDNHQGLDPQALTTQIPDGPSAPIDPTAPGPTDVLDIDTADRLAPLFGKALGKLAWRARLLLTLYHADGLTLGEIAILMGSTEPTVCKKLGAARKKLRGELSLQIETSPFREAFDGLRPTTHRKGMDSSPATDRLLVTLLAELHSERLLRTVLDEMPDSILNMMRNSKTPTGNREELLSKVGKLVHRRVKATATPAIFDGFDRSAAIVDLRFRLCLSRALSED